MEPVERTVMRLLCSGRALTARALLDEICRSFDAFGGVIWIADTDSGRDIPRSLQVLEYSLPGDHFCVLQGLSLRRAINGRVIKANAPALVLVSDLDREPASHVQFLAELGVGMLLAAPFHFIDGTAGVLNLYYPTGAATAEQHVDRARAMASALPHLLDVVEQRVRLHGVSQVGKVLREGAQVADDTSDDRVRDLMQSVVGILATTFDCVEASIFVIDNREVDRYTLLATTFEEVRSTSTYGVDDEALTSYAIAHRQPLLIVDLAKKSARSLAEKYPGIQWSSMSRRSANIRRIVGAKEDGREPPHSFMAVPLTYGTRVFGLIRCSISTQLRLFSSRDLHLLELLAGHVGPILRNWMQMHDAESENELWRHLVQTVGALNRVAYAELAKDEPGVTAILDEALRLPPLLFDDVSSCDVRLLNEDNTVLTYARTSGAGWDTVDPGFAEPRKDRRFSVAEPTIAREVMQDLTVREVAAQAPRDATAELFPDNQRMLVAPVADARAYGVLDVRRAISAPFPLHARPALDLLSHQLGLYYRLVKEVRKLKQSEREQRQAYEDLAHQMRTPTTQARFRAQDAVDGKFPERAEANLKAIRGLCRKAQRVALCTGFFTELARGVKPDVNLKEMTTNYLVPMLIEAASDTETLVDPTADLRFDVRRQTVHDALMRYKIFADTLLLEQAVNCLVDNAAKYAHANSVVSIYAGLTTGNRFHITVGNFGVRIRPDEALKCKQRHWRGEEAARMTAEGKGIGLWLVDQMLIAMGGELVIVPTTDKHYTEAKLILPALGR